MTNIRHVRQEDSHGCALASLAMVTGETYAEVKAKFSRVGIAQTGVTFFVFEDYLAQHGYACARLMYNDFIRDRKREPWPPEPFADVHMCEVMDTNGGHVVVMLADGTVLDPATDERKRLADYASVNFVSGVFKVRPETQSNA